MTDSYTQQLAQASWRGVVFWVRTEDLPTGGRKSALHDFPNSDERFIEDLGKIPPRFTVKAFVHGLDWLDRARSLENALSEKGPGRLVLPTFGAWTVWALPYGKSASQESIGEIEFSLEFATSRTDAGIIESNSTSETVFSAGDDARDAIGSAFGSIFSAPGDSLGFGAMISDVTSAANSAFSAISNLMSAETLGEATSALRSLLGNVGGLIGDPIQLALDFFGIDEDSPGLWQIISEGLDAVDSISALLNFSNNFGNNLALVQSDLDSGNTASTVEGISLWPATTQDRIERNSGRQAIVESNRVAALVVAYEQSANAEYQTVEEIQTVRTSLEDTFAEIMRVDAQEVDSVPADPEVRKAMDTLRIRALAVLDQKAQSAWLTTEINRTGALSAPSLAYLLYAESIATTDLDERSLELRQLNQNNYAAAMSGKLTVLRGSNA